uniref:BTB domain-containing protein n=1 Tax=Glossina brevipalpis TaxID=37001 RepID=A0A1A9W5K7_9MUSC
MANEVLFVGTSTCSSNFSIEAKAEGLQESVGVKRLLLKMGISKENVLSLFLLLEPCSMTSGVYVKPKFCILNIKKEQENISSSAKIWLFCEKSRFWGLTKFIEKNILFDKAANLLPDDELTIVCEIGMVNIVNICDQPKKTQYKVIEGKLNENLGNLLDNGKLSDVTFFVGDREVQAHKALLIFCTTRSDVFAAMFQHDMEESQINRIVVSDIDYDVLKEMLKFIYTDKAPNLDEMAHDLLAAADKYALENLKVMCEETLCTKISAENAAETLILADLHSATQLKAHAMDFIKT